MDLELKDLGRRCAIAGADVAGCFKDVQDAGGAGAAESELALEERDADRLLLAHHFETLPHHFLKRHLHYGNLRRIAGRPTIS